MKLEMEISLVALVVSILTFARTVLWDRRNRRTALLRKKQMLLESALENELTLSELYSNVLTTRPEDYRDEVREVLAAMREQLPGMIAKTQSAQGTLESMPVLDEQIMDRLASELTQGKRRVLSLASQLQHGLERGRLNTGTQQGTGADAEDRSAQP